MIRPRALQCEKGDTSLNDAEQGSSKKTKRLLIEVKDFNKVHLTGSDSPSSLATKSMSTFSHGKTRLHIHSQIKLLDLALNSNYCELSTHFMLHFAQMSLGFTRNWDSIVLFFQKFLQLDTQSREVTVYVYINLTGDLVFIYPSLSHLFFSMATSSVLYAAAKEIGSTCSVENENFLKCKAADEDPSSCLEKGEAVQACALGVLKSAMATCEETFQKYATCLDNQISEEYMFERCRKEEHEFRDCRTAAKESNSAVVAATTSEANGKERRP